ncbi:DUF397 domain-containing protein [Pseudonocardia lacus]|uniref:DUF397 domain-containing protein n=1 Tax=Pseudonocardia lacus TaxID=2835865 RepID=UPI0027E232E2|nr:DUF397 domain-containing protein [Pseudonocardia lacus]
MHIDSLDWRTSSFSPDNGNSCVEVAFLPDGGTALRDTKNRALPAHRYPADAWASFLAGVRTGEFTAR